MFDIGFFELALVLVLALIVVGPQRLPELMRQTLARWRQMRAWVGGVQQDIEQQLDVHSLEQDLYNQKVMRQLDRQKPPSGNAGDKDSRGE